MTKYYKVLRVLKNGRRVSAGDIPSKLRQAYHLTKPNFSKFDFGKLFVFNNKDKAYNFAFDMSRSIKIRHEVWEVKVTYPKEIHSVFPAWLYLCKNFFLTQVKDYWTKKSSNESSSQNNQLEEHTCCNHVCSCDSITLKSVIKTIQP